MGLTRLPVMSIGEKFLRNGGSRLSPSIRFQEEKTPGWADHQAENEIGTDTQGLRLARHEEVFLRHIPLDVTPLRRIGDRVGMEEGESQRF
jgi:hypothetical protein